MNVWRFGTMLVLMAIALCVAAPASAQDQEGLAAVLRDLSWNDPSKRVLEYFDKVKDEEFKEASSKVRDAVLKEELRQRKRAEYKEIADSLRRLSGSGRTGFEVSVIAGEFQKNNGESLLLANDEFSQKYYLFADDKLWRLVVAYRTEYIQGVGFEAFIEQVSRKYGEPDETAFDRDELARAVWRDDKTELRIENKLEFFNTFTMVFTDLETAKRMENVRQAFGQEKEEGVSDIISDIQEDDSFAVNDDIVDNIIGDTTEVDLERGMREDREMKRVGFEANAADANAAGDLAKEGEKRTKAAKPKARTKAKPATKPKSKDLIIY